MKIPSSIGQYFSGPKFIAHYAAIYSVFLFIDFAIFSLNPSSYQLNDWLINSAGGFVRRSIGGDLFLLVGRNTGLPVNILVFIALAPVLYVFCKNYFRLVAANYSEYWTRPILFSSAGLLPYAVSDFGGHKEILIFALFAYVSANLGEGDSARFRKIAASLFILPIIALIHEGLVTWFPFFFALLATVRISIGRLVVVVSSAAAISVATILSIIYRVPRDGTDAACAQFREALGIFGSADVPCHAMSGLTLDAADMNAKILAELSTHPFWVVVGVISFLAPVVYAIMASSPARYLSSKKVQFVSLCLFSSLAMTVPLSLVAVDWGRFLSIYVVMFAIGFLALSAKGIVKFRPVLESLKGFSRSDWRYAVALAALSCFPAKPVFAFYEIAALYVLPVAIAAIWAMRRVVSRRPIA